METLNPELQRLAKNLARQEETRRWYFQFLVEEKLWDIVKDLADHSLYDDQRGWALGKAMEDKRWDVMVVLADHGLTDNQLMRVHRQVAKHADMATVQQLFDRGIDMERVYEELMAANPSRERPPTMDRIERLRNMGEDVTKLEADYKLMEADQWILVARVMELSLDDTERRRVMQAALEKKEGSVVAHGISVMEGRLSVEEREVMYDQALSQGVWQAVQRLVEEKDDTGLAQRDKALETAVDQHRWDMVDHCDRHGADINKREAEGDTFLQKETKKDYAEDWNKVKGLLRHGADPNLQDRDGFSAFDYAIKKNVKGSSGRWDIVKIFVEFHGNITQYRMKAYVIFDDLIDKHFGCDITEGYVTDACTTEGDVTDAGTTEGDVIEGDVTDISEIEAENEAGAEALPESNTDTQIEEDWGKRVHSSKVPMPL
nr:hypothetical protein BaRGS_019606 [Batillaria attramentaria]